MPKLSSDALKPHLQNSSLYARNLPKDITDQEIRRIFKDFQVLHVKIFGAGEVSGSWRCQIWGDVRGTKTAQVEFSSITVAEKALAVLNLRVIRESEPLVLKLSASRDQSSLGSTFSGNPRLVKFLPSHYTDIQLYMLIRPFGPLASARNDHTLGGVVQFWNEDAARAAEVAVRSAFSRTSKIVLQAYDPCNIFCVNLASDVDESRLKTLFKPFGLVASVRVIRDKCGASRGYALATFHSPDETSNAIHALHGTLLGSKELVLRYHEPRTSSNPDTQSTGEAGLAKSTDGLTTDSLLEEAEKARKRAELQESEKKIRELDIQEKERIFQENARKVREEIERKAREREILEEKEKARQREEARLESWKEATRAEQERCRARDDSLWGHISSWADNYALQRVTLVSDEFSRIKFSEEQPLTFENIPWPVLGNPATLGVDNITWDNVEAFFAFAKIAQKADRYKKFIETIHRLFHPDKWRARRALETVMDANLRQALEAAGNIVSQAITPLWRETKNEG